MGGSASCWTFSSADWRGLPYTLSKTILMHSILSENFAEGESIISSRYFHPFWVILAPSLVASSRTMRRCLEIPPGLPDSPFFHGLGIKASLCIASVLTSVVIFSFFTPLY